MTLITTFSVSGDVDLRLKVFEMGDWLEQQLKTYGVETKKVDLNANSDADPKLPPIILGKIGGSPNLKTLLIYGHYDVQPVSDFPILCSLPLFRLVEYVLT